MLIVKSFLKRDKNELSANLKPILIITYTNAYKKNFTSTCLPPFLIQWWECFSIILTPVQTKFVLTRSYMFKKFLWRKSMIDNGGVENTWNFMKFQVAWSKVLWLWRHSILRCNTTTQLSKTSDNLFSIPHPIPLLPEAYKSELHPAPTIIVENVLFQTGC